MQRLSIAKNFLHRIGVEKKAFAKKNAEPQIDPEKPRSDRLVIDRSMRKPQQQHRKNS